MTGYPSIDKPWLKYYSEETINTPVPECTVYENIYRNNRNDLSNIALEYFGNKITYGEMFEKVEVAKKALLAILTDILMRREEDKKYDLIAYLKKNMEYAK